LLMAFSGPKILPISLTPVSDSPFAQASVESRLRSWLVVLKSGMAEKSRCKSSVVLRLSDSRVVEETCALVPEIRAGGVVLRGACRFEEIGDHVFLPSRCWRTIHLVNIEFPTVL